LNQAFAQHPFLHHPSHGITFPLPGYGLQPNTIPAMLVMPDPNFSPFYKNPLNYQGFSEQQISSGVRMNPVNGWKGRGYYY